MMVADAPITHQARGGRFVAAVHGHQVYVDVDEQVRLGYPPVHLDVLTFIRLPEHDEAGRVLGVVLQQSTVGSESVENPVAQAVPQLCVGHSPVQPEGGDQDHVVDACFGRHVQDRLNDPLTVVGPAHRRQR